MYLALDVEVLGGVVLHVLGPLPRAQHRARVHHDHPAQRLQLLPRDAHVPRGDARHLEVQRRDHLRAGMGGKVGVSRRVDGQLKLIGVWVVTRRTNPDQARRF